MYVSAFQNQRLLFLVTTHRILQRVDVFKSRIGRRVDRPVSLINCLEQASNSAMFTMKIEDDLKACWEMYAVTSGWLLVANIPLKLTFSCSWQSRFLSKNAQIMLMFQNYVLLVWKILCFLLKEKNTWKASWVFYVIWSKWKTSFCLFYTYIRLGSHKNYIFLDRLNTCNVFCQQLTRWLVLLLRDFLLGEGEGDCLECLCGFVCVCQVWFWYL